MNWLKITESAFLHIKVYQKFPNFQAPSLKLAITSEPKVHFNSNKKYFKADTYYAIILHLMIEQNFTFQNAASVIITTALLLLLFLLLLFLLLLSTG